MREPLRSARVECPGCGSSSFTRNADGGLVCDFCHTVYGASGPTCSTCGATYEPGAYHCPVCGADLARECRACGALNPLSARACSACGYALDMVDAMLVRATKGTADRLQELREDATAIKAQEEAASQARLTEMWAVEARQRDALARAQTERERQERMLITAAVVIVAVIVVAVLVMLAIEALHAPGSVPLPYVTGLQSARAV